MIQVSDVELLPDQDALKIFGVRYSAADFRQIKDLIRTNDSHILALESIHPNAASFLFLTPDKVINEASLNNRMVH